MTIEITEMTTWALLMTAPIAGVPIARRVQQLGLRVPIDGAVWRRRDVDELQVGVRFERARHAGGQGDDLTGACGRIALLAANGARSSA